jgi:RimJ/RimL family protein N-acetyltransferase
MTLTVRSFRPDEAAVLTAIRLEALADSPAAFSERYDVALAMGGEDFSAPLMAGAVFGAFTDTNCVGMAGLTRHTGSNVAHRATIWGVYVSPTARASGAATALLDAMVAHARSIGVDALYLGVGDYNVRAQAFYRRMGFAPIGFEPRGLKLDGRYIDEVLMARLL